MKVIEQTKNSLKLYLHGNPDSIEKLLKMQKNDVVDELKALAHTEDLKELALRLSLGVYDKPE